MSAQADDAKSIFLNAAERPAGPERDAYLAAACGPDAALRREVEELLAHHDRAGSFLKTPTLAPTIDNPAPAATAGATIGQYKLVEPIGEGGMGQVWLAQQQEPVRRLVALKVVKAGMDTDQVLARFEAERQALALMDHPNIAQVYDAGATPSGRPFFVMELVKGTPITKYCDEHRLTPTARLGLFVQVCRAVQHAHQKGIIHRDLKPSNVLVAPYDGQPVVKVIDFGIAKAAGQPLTDRTLVTGFGAVVGTPEYMSPEQAELNNRDVDTRSDVYSLGVLLYELLTGTTPLTKQRAQEAALAEVLRVIREEEPPKPSTRLSDSKERLPTISAQRQMEPAKLTKLLRGELDWIVMKALEKDRNRRYESANGLAHDVENYLNDEPVLACPPSAGYRFRRFARRNKVMLAAAGAGTLVVLLTVAGLIANNWQVTREKKRTEEALETAKAEKKRANENLGRARKAVRDYLQTTANDPRLKAADLQALRKNLLATAVPFFEEFAAINPDDPEAQGERGQAIFQLAYVREEMGETEKARDEYARSRDIFAALAAAHPEVHKYREPLAISLYNLGNVLDELNQPAEARAAYDEALAVIERLRAEDDQPKYRRHLAAVYLNLGTMLCPQKKLREGVDAFRRAVDILEKLVAEDPTNRDFLHTLATCRSNLATALSELKEDKESVALFRQAIEVKARLVELDRTNREYRDDLAMSKNNLGALLEGPGNEIEVESLYRDARELWAQLATDFRGIPEYRHKLAQSYYNRGNLLKRQDKPIEAMAAYRQAIGILETLTKDFRNPLYLEHLGLNANNLGMLLLDNDQPAEAELAFRTAISAEERLVANYPKTPRYAVTLGGNYVNAGLAMVTAGRAGPALPSFANAIATLSPLAAQKPQPTNAQWFLRNAHSNRAQALVTLKRYKDAISDWDRAVELSPEKERWSYRLGRMDALLKSGNHAGATTEADAAAKADGANANIVYDAACIHALAVAVVGADKVRAELYAGRAVELLRQAIGKGYKDVAHMKKDPDLESLRSRDDFKKLVAELEAMPKDGKPKK